MSILNRALLWTSAVLCAVVGLAGIVFLFRAPSVAIYPGERLLLLVMSGAMSVLAACNLACLYFLHAGRSFYRFVAIGVGIASSMLLMLVTLILELTHLTSFSMFIFWPAAITTIAALVFVRPKAIPPGHCQKCRYDLRGLEGGGEGGGDEIVCPECGSAKVEG